MFSLYSLRYFFNGSNKIAVEYFKSLPFGRPKCDTIKSLFGLSFRILLIVFNELVILKSSVIIPQSVGQFKSNLRKTFFPVKL